MVNTNLEGQICNILADSVDAQIFWLAFFKPQLSCPADEFVEAIRQLAEINDMGYYFYYKYKDLQTVMAACEFVISLEEHADIVIKVISEFVDEATHIRGVSPLSSQLKYENIDECGLQFVQIGYMGDLVVTRLPEKLFYQFKNDQSKLGKIRLIDVKCPSECDL